MTGSTLGTLLVLALTAALSPFSLVAFSLVLATDRGPRNGVAFICGWITTVTLIGVAMSFLGSSVSVRHVEHARESGPSRSSSRSAPCSLPPGRGAATDLTTQNAGRRGRET